MKCIVLFLVMFVSCVKSQYDNCSRKVNCTYTMYDVHACNLGTSYERVVIDTITMHYVMWDCESENWIKEMNAIQTETDPYIKENNPLLYELLESYKSTCDCEN